MSLPFSDDDLLPAIKNNLEKIKPYLQKDGGGVELIGIKNGVVYIQLQSACSGCSSAGATINNVIKRQFQIYIHPDIEVVNIAVGMENKIKKDLGI